MYYSVFYGQRISGVSAVDVLLIIMAALMLLCAVYEGWQACKASYRICSNTYGSVILCPIEDKTVNIEEMLRDIYSSVSGELCCKAIIIDFGANAEVLDICRRFIQEYGFFELIEDKETADSLKGLIFEQ